MSVALPASSAAATSVTTDVLPARPAAVPVSPVRVWRLLCAAFVLCLLDVQTTSWGLGLGMAEQNPVGGWLMSLGGLPVAALVTTVLFTAVVGLLGWLATRKVSWVGMPARLVPNLVAVFLVIKALTVLGNLTVICLHYL